MAWDIGNYLASISQYGIQMADKFDVNITIPQTISSLGYSFVNQFQTLCPLRAVSATSPGTSFLTNDSIKWGVGPRIKQPYNSAFADVKVNFLADRAGIIEQFFTYWMNYCYNYSFDQENTATLLTNYRDNVVSPSILVTKYQQSNTNLNGISLQYSLTDAIPTIVTAQDLDWNAVNTPSHITVSFNYVSYSMSSPLNSQ